MSSNRLQASPLPLYDSYGTSPDLALKLPQPIIIPKLLLPALPLYPVIDTHLERSRRQLSKRRGGGGPERAGDEDIRGARRGEKRYLTPLITRNIEQKNNKSTTLLNSPS